MTEYSGIRMDGRYGRFPYGIDNAKRNYGEPKSIIIYPYGLPKDDRGSTGEVRKPSIHELETQMDEDPQKRRDSRAAVLAPGSGIHANPGIIVY